MKKLLYTFLAVSIIFSACEEEDTSPANTNNNNSGNNNNPSNLIGDWHSEEVFDEYRGNMYYQRIHFFSNGDCFIRSVCYAAVPNSQNQEYNFENNTTYETPDDGYINIENHGYITWDGTTDGLGGSTGMGSTSNYFKYNINGNILTFTDLDGESVYWHSPIEHPFDHPDEKAVYTKQ